jgi:hypothetical protein
MKKAFLFYVILVCASFILSGCNEEQFPIEEFETLLIPDSISERENESESEITMIANPNNEANDELPEGGDLAGDCEQSIPDFFREAWLTDDIFIGILRNIDDETVEMSFATEYREREFVLEFLSVEIEIRESLKGNCEENDIVIRYIPIIYRDWITVGQTYIFCTNDWTDEKYDEQPINIGSNSDNNYSYNAIHLDSYHYSLFHAMRLDEEGNIEIFNPYGYIPNDGTPYWEGIRGHFGYTPGTGVPRNLQDVRDTLEIIPIWIDFYSQQGVNVFWVE